LVLNNNMEAGYIYKNTKRWMEDEIKCFERFILEHREMLETNFNENKSSSNSKKKSKGFFKKMSFKIRSKDASQCKSRFQKQEKHIYVSLLEFNLDTYEEMLKNRKKRSGRIQRKLSSQPEVEKTSITIQKPKPIRVLIEDDNTKKEAPKNFQIDQSDKSDFRIFLNDGRKTSEDNLSNQIFFESEEDYNHTNHSIPSDGSFSKNHFFSKDSF
jgi:hypothetical protein